MWLITNFGFFSVVEKPGDKKAGLLTVRARAKADLEHLKERYLPSMGAIVENAGTDYPYRVQIPRDTLAIAMLRLTQEIDYSNFKSSVSKVQGHERSGLYHDVWDTLYKITGQEKMTIDPSPVLPEPSSPSSALRLARETSYGGVVIDAQGRVLLREPQGHFDGYVWTFAKGRPAQGDSPASCAQREVQEETGYKVSVIDLIPGSFKGGQGQNVYFLMKPNGEQGHFDPKETQKTCWSTWDEARALIDQTTNSIGRQRDLAVLEAARKLWEQKNS